VGMRLHIVHETQHKKKIKFGNRSYRNIDDVQIEL